ncbi:Serine/Threonine-kinase [Rhynchospora pubera]|nr:Serine/Threonine-kinase [Rhynchospora pubera]
MCEYKFPDPIPEFAEAETEKFKEHMLARLTKKKQYFGDSVQEIVDICTEILNQFLRTEYGGPGTLLVIPFIDMAEAIKEKELPGSPQAARAAVVWAQNNIDKDWEKWNAED